MERLATRQSPAANRDEKHFIRWVKERGICAACGNNGGVIAHHFAGSSCKVLVGLQRAYIGHYAVNGLCLCCDNLVTHMGRKAFREAYGAESELWLMQIQHYPIDIPILVIQGVLQWGKQHEALYL